MNTREIRYLGYELYLGAIKKFESGEKDWSFMSASEAYGYFRQIEDKLGMNSTMIFMRRLLSDQETLKKVNEILMTSGITNQHSLADELIRHSINCSVEKAGMIFNLATVLSETLD